MRRVFCALPLALLGTLAARAQAPEPAPASPLQRLAQRLADDVARLAPSGPLEFGPLEDRTDAAAGTWATDLHALVAERLRARLARPGERAQARVLAILSQAGARLIVSARVEEASGARLIDLISVSAEIDPALLTLSASSPRAAARAVEVVSSSRTVPLDERVLDLAWVDDERLLLLSPQALALYRWVDTSFTLESRRLLPHDGPTVRAPGGVLALSRGESSVWALTSGAGRAQRFAIEISRLIERAQADALPHPGLALGLRFRFGTDLLEAELPGLGAGPWLAFEPSWPDAAVSADAELLLAGPEGPRRTGLRVGAALAPLWNDLVAAASADPPAARDAILLLRADGASAGEVSRLAVDGAVRALAALASADGARLVAGIEEPGGAFHLELFELRRPEAGAELP